MIHKSRETLQIHMTSLKGEHAKLADDFNKYYMDKKMKRIEFVELYKALRKLHTIMQKVEWELYTYKLRPSKKKNFLK